MPILTIGHSNHPLDRFLTLIADAGVKVIADVRSVPHSRRFPHFGQTRLVAALKGVGVDYVFFGDSLGGRPKDESVWRNGRPDYTRMAQTPLVRDALADVRRRAAKTRLCLMCSEKEPLDCHRCLLVARALVQDGAEVRNLLADGGVEPHTDTENRLLTWAGKREADLMSDVAQRLDAAYDMRADWLWKTGPSKGRAKPSA
jgi:uncharacterized protein (DUF488 family)